jgi:SNF2 family DNA or RNA helicase
LFYSLLFKH